MKKIFLSLLVFTLPALSLAALPVQSKEGPTGWVPGEPGSCYTYLSDYLYPDFMTNADGTRKYPENEDSQVRRLQEFLIQYQGADLEVTGYYGPKTMAAVKKFQEDSWWATLIEWSWFGFDDLHAGSGLVYKTTKMWINMLNCPGLVIDLPQLP